ncbi:MAG: hypothetical protein JNL66_17840 [Alphaproteobacteria bacterium]|nr:hypothetical protein [Alphaproteobacteria bacterium]
MIGSRSAMLPGEQPYLVGNLIALPMLALAWLAAGPQRRAMVASGAFCAPLGALSIVMGDYWSPQRVGGLALGLEDFLFSFQAGASAWFWGSLVVRRSLVVTIALRAMIGRLLGVAIASAAILSILWAAGMSGPAAVFVLSLVIVGAVLAWRPRLWGVAAATALLFSGTYVLLLWGLFALLPELSSQWPSGAVWATPVFGLPVGEYIWALVGAPAHVLCFCYIAQADLHDPARERQRSV